MTRTLEAPPRATPAPGEHEHKEHYPWGIRLVDHPPRFTSSAFRAAKQVAKKILTATADADLPYGPGPWEMHHAGSLWVKTASGWRMYRARVGIEWSLQFCAEPAKVDRLRLDAKELVEAFPLTLPALAKLGYPRAERLLRTPITNADEVAAWTDSLFNACVPLTHGDHQGILPDVPGEHHYPWPVKGADFVRYDDFPFWVTLPDGTDAAVTPLNRRGSGDGHLRLVYGLHGTLAGEVIAAAQKTEQMAVIRPDSKIALKVFERQIPPGSRTASVPLVVR